MNISSRILVVLMLGMLGSAVADENCPGILLKDEGELEKDYMLVCQGLRDAVDFFHRHGMELQHPLKVMVHDGQIVDHVDHIGLYNKTADRVDLLSYAQASRLTKVDPPFGTPMNEAIYTSFATHEFAHALAEDHFTYDDHAHVVQEYIAYVVQFTAMDETLRDQIMGRYKVSAFESFDDVSLMYYMLDPNAFGVKAYRHFSALDDPVEFIDKLFTGEIRVTNPRSEWW